MPTERLLHENQKLQHISRDPTIRCGAHKRKAVNVLVTGPAKNETLRQLFDRMVAEAARSCLATRDADKKLVPVKGPDGGKVPALSSAHMRHEIAENIVSEALSYPGWREPLLEMTEELKSRGQLLAKLGEALEFHIWQTDASRG